MEVPQWSYIRVPLPVTSVGPANSPNPTTTSFAINWEGGDNATYTVIDVHSTSFNKSFTTTTVGFFECTGLQPTTSYSVTVTPYIDVAGTSASGSGFFTKPDAVSNIQVFFSVPAPPYNVAVYWDPVPRATQYRLFMTGNLGYSQGPFFTTTIPFIFTGLQLGEYYDLFIYTWGEYGDVSAYDRSDPAEYTFNT
jgi:hypothetical protein